MRGFVNVLRHDYDVISEKMIWEIAQDFLPGLLDDCRRALPSNPITVYGPQPHHVHCQVID